MNKILCAMHFSASSVNRRSARVFTCIFGVATADPRSTLRLTQPALVQCYPARHETTFSVPHILNLAVRIISNHKKAWTQRQKWTNLGSKLCVSEHLQAFNLPPLNAAKQLVVVWLYPELTARSSKIRVFKACHALMNHSEHRSSRHPLPGTFLAGRQFLWSNPITVVTPLSGSGPRLKLTGRS